MGLVSKAERIVGVPAGPAALRVREKWVGLEEPALKGFKEKFTSSTSQMRGLLADPEKNVPKEEADFTPTDDLSVCARCVFRRPCGREGSALASTPHRPP